MKIISGWFLGAVLVCGLLSGCHSKDESATQMGAAPAPIPPSAPDAATASPQSPTTIISSARSSLKAGNVDEAAARLAELQLQGAKFNAQQAKDYRQALSEAYDRTIEAAQRGDPRAQAALQLLRAAGPR